MRVFESVYQCEYGYYAQCVRAIKNMFESKKIGKENVQPVVMKAKAKASTTKDMIEVPRLIEAQNNQNNTNQNLHTKTFTKKINSRKNSNEFKNISTASSITLANLINSSTRQSTQDNINLNLGLGLNSIPSKHSNSNISTAVNSVAGSISNRKINKSNNVNNQDSSRNKNSNSKNKKTHSKIKSTCQLPMIHSNKGRFGITVGENKKIENDENVYPSNIHRNMLNINNHNTYSNNTSSFHPKKSTFGCNVNMKTTLLNKNFNF